MDLSLGSVFWKHSNNFCLRSWRSLIFAGRAFTSVHVPHICHVFSPFTRVASLTLWNLHFTISPQKITTTTIAGSHQLISHLATAALHIPYIPLSSSSVLLLILFLTFGESFHLLPVFAQIQFKTLLPSYTAAGHHMKGFAAPQFLLCSARPVRKANSPTTVKERPEFHLIIKPYSCTWTINILFLLLRQAS